MSYFFLRLVVALAFLAPFNLAAASSQQRARIPILKEPAKLVVTIFGGPGAGQQAAQMLTLSFNAGRGAPIEIEHPFDDSRGTYTIEVPANAPLRVTLTSPRVHFSAKSKLRIAPGLTEQLTIDLGYSHLRRAQLVGVPCEVLKGALVHTFGPFGSFSFSNEESRSFFSHQFSYTDDKGRAWALDPPQEKAKGYCTIGDERFEVELRTNSNPTPLSSTEPSTTPAATRESSLQVAPKSPLIGLRSPHGTKISIGDPDASTPKLASAFAAKTPANFAVLAANSLEGTRIFLDETAIGTIDLERAQAFAGHCLHVEDLPLLPAFPALEVTLTSSGRGPYELILNPAENPAILGHQGRYGRGGGSIVAPGKTPRNRAPLGFWDTATPGVWTCQVRVPPDTYTVAVMDESNNQPTIRLTPIVVRSDQNQALTLDMDIAQQWRVAPRLADRSRFTHFVGTGGLNIAGCDVWIRPFPPMEDCATFSTFDGEPTEASLYGSPGANGRVVPLRAVHSDDEARHINLIAVLPRASRIFIEIDPVASGRFGGISEQSDDPPEVNSVLIGHSPPRTVQGHWNDRVGVCVRDETASGIVFESSLGSGQAPILRDWFTATPQQGQLMSDGQGRYIQVTSTLKQDVVLRLRPKALSGHSLSMYEIALVQAGSSKRIWVSNSAEVLDWLPIDERARRGLHLPRKAGGEAPLGSVLIQEQSSTILQ